MSELNFLKGRVIEKLRDSGIVSAESEADRIVNAATDESMAMQFVAGRVAGTPLSLLLGVQKFLGYEFFVEFGALIPRKETELLALVAIDFLSRIEGRELKIIDMCCGVGNLSCVLAKHFPQAHIWASDLTEQCASLTRRNVEQLGLTQQIEVCKGDLFAPLVGRLEGAVDAVVCNPPYISASKLNTEKAELLEHEPREAFDGGPYGLTIHQRVLKDTPRFLKSGGVLMMEFGLGQQRQLELLLRRIEIYQQQYFYSDDAGEPRVLVAIRGEGLGGGVGQAGCIRR